MESISSTWILNYESKTHVVNSKISGSFSISIRVVERTLVRSPSGHEFLAKQKAVAERNEAVVEILYIFLASEEICRGYIANVFTKAKIEDWTQDLIVPKISRDAISMSRRLGEKGIKGFLLEADVEIVQERWLDNWLNPRDYDSQGRLIPVEQDCTICLEELSLGGQTKIMKLFCFHNFHRDCILKWLRRKHSCPTCRDDVQNPRPQKEVESVMFC
ncbi:unnamed protein product [Arabidopsis halleri]